MNLPVVIVGLSTMKVVGAWPRRPVTAPPVRSRAAPMTTGKLTFTVEATMGPSSLDARQRNPYTGSTENTGSLGKRASAVEAAVAATKIRLARVHWTGAGAADDLVSQMSAPKQ